MKAMVRTGRESLVVRNIVVPNLWVVRASSLALAGWRAPVRLWIPPMRDARYLDQKLEWT